MKSATLSWKQKMEDKAHRKMLKAMDDEIKAQRAEEERKRKEARKQSIIRRKQNIAKNTVVQQITNKKKLRHMGARQFRQLKNFHFDEIE